MTSNSKTAARFNGRCAGHPYAVPVESVTAAQETARTDAGWTQHNHPYRATTGKPGAWLVRVPCYFTTTDGPAYAAHLRTVHGAKGTRTDSLPGKGFRLAPKTAGEKLALGKTVTVSMPDGTEIAGQVWSEADPTIVGARRGTAFFAVADGRTFAFTFDSKAPGAPCSARELDSAGREIARGMTVRLVRGPVAEMTLDESFSAPVASVPVVVDDSFSAPVPAVVESVDESFSAPVADIVAAGVDSGRVILVSVDAPKPAPETVPAPMPPMTRAARKATRREIAATMRAEGLRPEGAEWRARCAAAGLPVREEVSA